MIDAKLFPPALLTALGLRPLPPERGGGAMPGGRHRSPHPGDSAEFQDYRAYVPGDDLRRIDWNIFRRSRKLLLRQYRNIPHKTHLILLDNTGSIRCRPERTLTAWRLAALLGGSLLRDGDRVKLVVSGKNGVWDFLSGRDAITPFLAVLERAWHGPAATGALQFDFPAADHRWVISDFMDPAGLDHLEAAVRRSPGFTPVRIYDPEEESPSPLPAIRLIDAETAAEVTITPTAESYSRYRSRLRRFKAVLEVPAFRSAGRVYGFDATLPVEGLIRRFMTEVLSGRRA